MGRSVRERWDTNNELSLRGSAVMWWVVNGLSIAAAGELHTQYQEIRQP